MWTVSLPLYLQQSVRTKETKHPANHYISAALDRSTESNYQTSTGTKWQITPPRPVSLYFALCALSLSLCLSWSLCLSPPFQQALSSLSFLPVVSHLSCFNSPSTALPVFRFFTVLLSSCPSSLPAHFHIPHLPKSISAPVRHVLSSQRIRPLSRCREWTMTYFPLSLIKSGWGWLKPGSEPALVSAWQHEVGACRQDSRL